MAALRWGIVGYGWVARDYAAPAMRAAGHTIVAIADRSAIVRDQARASGVPSAFDDAEALIRHAPLDAVYVATPNHRHREAVETVARAGLPILCEKPMAATRADADAIARAVERDAVPFRTAFDQRHHPAHAAMRALVRDGAIGTPTAIRIVYACWLGPNWSPDGGAHDNWRADPARAGGGALIDLAPHGIDLAAFLLDERLVRAHALLQHRVHAYAVDDGAMLTARSESGVLVSLGVAYNHPDALPRRRLELVGTEGMLVATDTMGQVAGGSVTLQTRDAPPRPVRFDADLSPFTAQIVAFEAAAAAGTLDRNALHRDLAHHHLLARAVEDEASCP